ncbi:MAG: hypothetical protein WC799_18080 [Desulfobacteraceae bacterium]
MPRQTFFKCLISLLFFLCVSPFSLSFADQNKLVLFPFSVYSESNMDFLKKGTGDLIETKLSGKGLNVVRSETEMNKTDAVKHSLELSADNYVTGSLTFLGNTISINALLIDVKTGSTLVSYTKADSDKDRLFSHISEFAEQAAGTIKKPVPDPPVPVAATEPEPKPVVTAAPVLAAPIKPPSIILTSGTRRSQDLPYEVYALAVGDVDGDEKKDIIFAERHSFSVASFNDKSLDIKKRIEGESFLDILFIDAFDANKNGIDEIFVTAVHIKSNKLSSSVYEWNGKEYHPIQKELTYFFRAGKNPETGKPLLLGQEQHFAQGVFGESIFEMIWSSGRQSYIPLKILKTPEKNLFIYGIDSGDIKNNGLLCSLVYLPDDRLAIFDFKKQSTWKSSGQYGGSNKFIETQNQDTKERFYFPARLITGDFDNNKTHEFATLVNTNSTPRIFNNLRNYTQGRVECHEWKSLNFETIWKTQDVSGYIPDFFISDLNGDGQNDVIYPVVNKSGFIIGKYTTYIVVQPIGF